MNTLVVDDDETLRFTLRYNLEMWGFEVCEAESGEQALELMDKSEKSFDLVFLDINMPGLSGLEVLKIIKQDYPQSCCIMLTAYADIKDAVYAIKNGAFDYLEKPFEGEHLLSVINAAKQADDLIAKVVFSAPKVKFANHREIIGGSSEIKKVYDIIFKLSRVDTSVLIRGESGTGKELVARAIHFNSDRKKGPFVAINCAAIPENLIESELFGYEKGAFTGAERKKIGKLDFAKGGTLFLDEIGDISHSMQVKLLRVLQEKVFVPIGGLKESRMDVRIIAASNKDFEKLVEKGEFRLDLFYRLNVLPIDLPPLRERCEDIPLLCDFLVEKFNKTYKRSIKNISKEGLDLLKKYRWPGNIRELENVIEHAFIIEDSNIISLESLPKNLNNSLQLENKIENILDSSKANNFFDTKSCAPSKLDFPAMKEKFERDFLVKALKTFSGKINQTAIHTKMTKVTLLRKLEKYDLNPKEFY